MSQSTALSKPDLRAGFRPIVWVRCGAALDRALKTRESTDKEGEKV
jgi:hypothetical protein